KSKDSRRKLFYLSLIEHSMRLPPHRLNLPLDEAVKIELETLFLDKVIAKLGLCISVYDIRSIKGGFIFPGDGASTCTVEFRLIVFRPFVGEIIVAKLKESDANDLRLTLGFFYDIYIPVHLLPSPSRFESDTNNKNQGRWIWDFGEADAQSEEPRFVIDGTDQIKFQVYSVSYTSIPLEQPENSKPFAPMVITGSTDNDGLGPVSWWEEAEMVQEES
ncbi:DNA-directed RNA polymerase III subunit RPC8-like, partial [Durio zibethinus]|uniref:DNA-directed RNA polymerase subunit n=1 Tax=Durio zibethinus TaxID=66656 RepID=A0A6P5XJ14_DURZI